MEIAGRTGAYRSVLSVQTETPVSVMTFDDGPDPVGTPDVLRALRSFDATATFFLLGTRWRRYPDLVQHVLEEGHEVALHGADHTYLPPLSAEDVARRTADARDELASLIGRPVRWVRPPYLAQGWSSWRGLVAAGLTPVYSDPVGPSLMDWAPISMDERLAFARRGLRAGAVVLGHDGYAGPEDGADDGPGPEVDRYELVARTLEMYSEQGLRGVSLEDALVDGSPVLGGWASRDPGREPRLLLRHTVKARLSWE